MTEPILQKDDATQEEIDAECEALQTAIQALVPLENQSSSANWLQLKS